jgi:hypothetical protein
VTQLAVALERFNRKERNLLIRAALGHQETALKLSAGFREHVASALGIASLPEDAWWATDYHIDWLAGALATYLADAPVLRSSRANPVDNATQRRLVEGNQEDIDLLIAAGQDLIMVEAKAYGAWSNAQMASKLARLNLLQAYYAQIVRPEERPIRFHILLTSPMRPQKLAISPPAWSGPGPELPWSNHWRVGRHKTGPSLQESESAGPVGEHERGARGKGPRGWYDQPSLDSASRLAAFRYLPTPVGGGWPILMTARHLENRNCRIQTKRDRWASFHSTPIAKTPLVPLDYERETPEG